MIKESNSGRRFHGEVVSEGWLGLMGLYRRLRQSGCESALYQVSNVCVRVCGRRSRYSWSLFKYKEN